MQTVSAEMLVVVAKAGWIPARAVLGRNDGDLGSLAANEGQSSVKFEVTPSPVCGDRVAEGEVLRRLHEVAKAG